MNRFETAGELIAGLSLEGLEKGFWAKRASPLREIGIIFVG